MMNRVVIYTDGACKNNGVNKSVGGIGVYFDSSNPNDPKNISKKITGYVTNNRAELMAVIEAIYSSIFYQYSSIEIKSDSTYVVRGMNEWINGWKRRNWKKVKNVDLWQWLDRMLTNNRLNIKWTHVAAHSGIYGNEMADTLANQCL